MQPIQCDTSFSLETAVKAALQNEGAPDDIPVRPDPRADEFWSAVASSSPSAVQPTSTPPLVFKDNPTATTKGQPGLASLKRRPSSDLTSNGRRHLRRKLCRQGAVEREGRKVDPHTTAQLAASASFIHTQLDVKGLPASSTGYIARNTAGEGNGLFVSLQQALDSGFKLIEWDGVTIKPLVSVDGKIFGCLAGRPVDDNTYLDSCDALYEVMKDAGAKTEFSNEEQQHRRGDFPAVNIGVTMGLGATYPTNLGVNQPDVFKSLLGDKNLLRVIGFIDCAFATWAPSLYAHYQKLATALYGSLHYLERLFPMSVFAAAAFNFGPHVWTRCHRDSRNFAVGWCGIVALGRFDSKKGGHLVLPDLRIVIEFPPGSLIFIPSATLIHANIPIQEGEERASFTQYCGGELFRYHDNGFCTEKELKKKNPKQHEKMLRLKETRWKTYLELYSTLDEIVSPVTVETSGGTSGDK